MKRFFDLDVNAKDKSNKYKRIRFSEFSENEDEIYSEEENGRSELKNIKNCTENFTLNEKTMNEKKRLITLSFLV